MTTRTVQNALNAGELSPSLSSRDDINKYYSGASSVSNFIPQAQGGVIKRSGGKWIAKAKGACDLIDFSFSASDSMVIEAGNLYMRFYKDSDRVMSDSVTIVGITLSSGNPVSVEATTHLLTTGMQVRFSDIVGTTELNYVGLNTEFTVTRTDADNFTLDGTDGDDFTAWTSGGTVAAIYEIVSPYSATEIFDVHKTPVADIVRLVHEDFLPYKLSRIADNNWTLEVIEPETGPFLTANTTATKTLELDKVFSGTHTGIANQDGTALEPLTDSTKSWTTDELVGYVVYNETDGSSGTITSNGATTIVCSGGLSDGTGDDWDTNDVYYIDSKYYIPAGHTALDLTAVGHAPFVANHVGSYRRLNHTRADNVADLAAIGVSDPVAIKGDFNLDTSGYASNAVVDLQRKAGEGEWQSFRKFTAATAYAGSELEDNVEYRLEVTVAAATAKLTAQDQVHEGVVKITSITSTTVAVVTAVTDVYFDYEESDNQTSEWAEGAWSLLRGYPRACTLYENRMWYAASAYRPQDIWASKSGEYDDMTAGPYDNDGFTIELNDSDVSQVEWLVGFQRLYVGTSKKEYMLSASNPTDPITPNDINAKVQSSYGSSHIQPVILNDGVFYAQRQGKRIRIITLNEYGDRQVSGDATRLSNHMFESAPIQFSVQNTPDSVVWVPREDGQTGVFVYDPAEEVVSWSRCVTGSSSDSPRDQYTSFATIPGDTEDEVWYVVSRTIDSSVVTYIEQIAPRIVDQIDESLMLDSALVVGSDYDAKDIIVASDTVRFNSGEFGSGTFGGVA